MKTPPLPRILLLCALLFNVAWGAEPLNSRVLVKFKSETTTSRRLAIEEEYQLSLLREIKLFKIHVYSYDEKATSVAILCEKLKLEEGVEAAEPDKERKISSVNDPGYTKQWYLNNTGQTVNGKSGPAGIDIRWPAATSRYKPQAIIKVAVIDSGVAILHPDIVTSTYHKTAEVINGIDDDNNGLIDDWCGYDVFSDDSLAFDQNGHGTLVAGIIAAEINNYTGGSGITNNVEIIPYRVFDQFGRGGNPKYRLGNTGISDVLIALAHAVEEGSKIINLSLEGGGFSPIEQEAYNQLVNENVLAVIAAGNGGADDKGDDNDIYPTYPASYPSSAIIAVAAQRRSGGLADFSNYGVTSVDIAAPGTDIYGPDVTRKTLFYQSFDSGAPGWMAGRNANDQSNLNWSIDYDGSNGYLTDRLNYTEYPPNTDTWVKSPFIDLSAAAGSRLEFDSYFDLADDYIVLEVSDDGLTWVAYEYFYSDEFTAFSTEPMDISDLDGQSGYLRFRLVSDYSLQGYGAEIDNVKITAIDDFDANNPSYTYSDGTSFAAPVVAGVAAMVWTHRPDLTAAQVRNCILLSARPVSLLSGKVATGGMVDANAALIYADSLPKSTQSIDFSSIPNLIYSQAGNNQVPLSATSSTGLPITYEVISGPATISNNILTITGPGTVTVRAYNSGTNSYTSASTSQSFTVSQAKQQQTISFPQPSDKTFGDAPFVVTSSASSGLATSLSLVSGPGTLNGNTLTITGAGQIVLRCTQAGDSAFEAASPAERTITVNKQVAVIGTGGLIKTYNGSRHTISSATSPAGLNLLVTYDGQTLGPIDAGTYQVGLTISDVNYTGSSTAVLVIEKANQSITPPSIPSQINYTPSSNALTLNATSSSGLPVSYSVINGPATVSGSTLTLTGGGNVTLRSSQGGNNNYNGAASVDTTIRVNDANDVPRVISQPTTVLAAVNSNAFIDVTTSGTGLRYQWYFAGKAIKGAVSEDLSIKVTPKSAGFYTLTMIDNTGDVAKASVTLLVALTPKITTTPPKAITVALGGSATLSVAASGEGLSYQWFRNGAALEGRTSATLAILSATPETSGNYTVRVSNIAGSVTSKGTTLTVLAPPTVGTITGPSTVATRSGFTLAVIASGPGKLSYQWRLNGNPIPKATTLRYTVKAATSANAGTYTVTVSNSAGSTTSAAYQLTIIP